VVRTPKRIPVLVSAAMALFAVAWLMATPPGSAPDEPAHYVKAIGVGRGEPYGSAPVVTREELRNLVRRDTDDAALRALRRAFSSSVARWQERTRRLFGVPPELLNVRFGCTFGDGRITGACLGPSRPASTTTRAESYMGTYQPYLYVPAGLAIRAAATPETALRLGRGATLAVALCLLIAAVWLLWSPEAGALSLLGLVAAVTPMVLFVSATLSPSGPEIASGICFAAALLRLARDDPPPRGLWVALGASGAILGASRSLGPIFVVLLVAAVAVLGGPDGLLRRARGGGAWAIAALVAVGGGVAAGAIWEASLQPHPSLSVDRLVDAIEPSVAYLPEVGKQAIGFFGSLDAEMPATGYALWVLLLGGLATAAFAAGDGRTRAAIVAVVVAATGVTVVLSLPVRQYSPLQGRYILPLLVLVPLWLGEVVLRRRARLPIRVRTALVTGGFAIAAVVQLLGWWASARRFAVGTGGEWLFFGSAAWSPPFGWWPWLLVSGAAAASYLGAAAAVPRRVRERPTAPT
jgi:Predicted membrane protein (DUF2142)